MLPLSTSSRYSTIPHRSNCSASSPVLLFIRHLRACADSRIRAGKTDVINDANDMHYKTSAPYFRIGMDYNVFYQKPYLPGYLYVGLRYGMSSFTYDASGPDMTDPNYGGHITVPFADLGVKSNASWLEGVVGIKVKIYKRFHMGWAVRYKMRMSVDSHENSNPWYVPGFGKNAGSSSNLTYNLIYNLPF